MYSKQTQPNVTPDQLTELVHIIAHAEGANVSPANTTRIDLPDLSIRQDIVGPRVGKPDTNKGRIRRRRVPVGSSRVPQGPMSVQSVQEGCIAIAAVQQADGAYKMRPVLLLRRMPLFGDYLVCAISTKLEQTVPGFDEQLVPSVANQLVAVSVVRLSNLVTIPASAIDRVIGFTPNALHVALLQRLASHLTLRSA